MCSITSGALAGCRSRRKVRRAPAAADLRPAWDAVATDLARARALGPLRELQAPRKHLQQPGRQVTRHAGQLNLGLAYIACGAGSLCIPWICRPGPIEPSADLRPDEARHGGRGSAASLVFRGSSAPGTAQHAHLARAPPLCQHPTKTRIRQMKVHVSSCALPRSQATRPRTRAPTPWRWAKQSGPRPLQRGPRSSQRRRS